MFYGYKNVVRLNVVSASLSHAIFILLTFQIEHILKIINGIIVSQNNTSGADTSSVAMRPMNESGGYKACNLDFFFEWWKFDAQRAVWDSIDTSDD